jgi:hypothetical protein
VHRTVGIGSKRQPRARRLSADETAVLLEDYALLQDRVWDRESGTVRSTRLGNHRLQRRWRRSFARCAAVAYDALEQQDRPRAIEIMCQVVCLEHAIALTGDGAIVAQSEMRDWTYTFAGGDPGDCLSGMEPFRGVDRGITLDSLLNPPVIGTRRRIEARSAPLPNVTNLVGMAPGQPTRFEFTQPGQAVDLERRADGWHVVGMLRSSGTTIDVGDRDLTSGHLTPRTAAEWAALGFDPPDHVWTFDNAPHFNVDDMVALGERLAEVVWFQGEADGPAATVTIDPPDVG